MKTSSTGFTLVEIMIVVAIIGLLAAIAIPNYLHARTESKGILCSTNLEMLDAAKQQWGFENNAGNEDTPVMDDLKIYMQNQSNSNFQCPSGGNYTIGNLGTVPSCTLATGDGKHELR